jgi:hypothetical protein
MAGTAIMSPHQNAHDSDYQANAACAASRPVNFRRIGRMVGGAILIFELS